jgi:hypothetical protein
MKIRMEIQDKVVRRYFGRGSGISIDGDPPKRRVVLVRWDSLEK